MRDFLRSPTENRHIPFPTLVTNLVEAAWIRGSSREKRVLPRLGPITNKTEAKSRVASTRPRSAHPPPAIFGASSSSALSPMSTSSLKRMECRIKGWFKCILGSRSNWIIGSPGPHPDLEGDSDELDDCVDEDAFSSAREEDDEE